MKLINHRFSDELLRNIKDKVRKFFDLPLEGKKRGSLEGYGKESCFRRTKTRLV